MFRESGGVPAVVQLLSKSTSASQQLQLLAIISSLSAGGEAVSDALANASTASVLLDLVSDNPLPRTQVHQPLPQPCPAEGVGLWGGNLLQSCPSQVLFRQYATGKLCVCWLHG